jgi:hypothetical protein
MGDRRRTIAQAEPYLVAGAALAAFEIAAQHDRQG